MGPVTSPEPRAAESMTSWREIAHWIANLVVTLDRTGESARSWSRWYWSESTGVVLTLSDVADLAVTGLSNTARSTAPVLSADTIAWSSGMIRNSSVFAPGVPA